jgi:acyl-CoA dehydrogenase
MMTGLVLLLLAALAARLLYQGRAYAAWTLPGAAALAWWVVRTGSPGAGAAALGFAVVAAATGIPALRRQILSRGAMRLLRPMLPRMSDTEQVALEAGTVWWERDLFSGRPDWHTLLAFTPKPLSDRERAFLDGPVEELCSMIREWDVVRAGDLPPAVWSFLKHHRFLGMIIPEEYGGLGFSAGAHSAVIVKLASRSVTTAVTVMVPNSLGPAELLLRYGTDKQKRHYLPRLARGDEIPCFALTGPEAGSDAAATQSVGIVCRDTYRGEEVIGIRLNWHKRYITLGPVATVIGLAFRLRDPDGLLGGAEDLGITCALVPADAPGIEIGARHDPMGIPFQNGPNWGRDVVVPLDAIIGGRDMAGQGWRMLMESLAAGRSISLPALACASAQIATRLVGAYATVREQFDTPIGRFEGIEEPLARIGGLTYVMNAARWLTAGAVDAGEHPVVASAIVKAYLTDLMRRVVNDAMDIRAGAAICRGPRNILAGMYQAVPVGITVEGANILTRSMIIYGQGAIRCHPFLHDEITAARAGDLAAFDRAFFGHIGHVASMMVRACVLGVTDGRMARVPEHGATRRMYGQFTRMSAAFALVSEVALATLGASLKRREKISGRLADALAWLYLGSSALKRFHDEGSPDASFPFVRFACEHALHEIQVALEGVLHNLPNRFAARVVRPLVFPFGARYGTPSDSVGAQVARGLLEDREARQSLTADVYVPPPDEPGLGRLEAALHDAVAAHHVETKIRDAIRAGRLDKAPGDILLEAALALGVVSREEYEQVLQADQVRDEVIQVDAFPQSGTRPWSADEKGSAADQALQHP